MQPDASDGRARGPRQGVSIRSMTDHPETEASDAPDEQAFAAPTPPRQVWWHNAALAGLAVSFFLHSALMLILAMMLFNRGPDGDAGEGDEIQLAVMSESELTELLDLVDPASDQQPTIEDETITPVFDREDLHSPLTDVGTAQENSFIEALESVGAGDLGRGGARDGLFHAGGTAKFFGIEARGSRFAYVIDISGSMQGDRSDAMKRALMASIDSLSDDASFSIVLYNDRATAITGDGWIRCSDSSRRTARQRIDVIAVGGNTNPVAAFDVIRSLQPLPDAVYFMTDGEFMPEVAEGLLLTVTQLVRAMDSPMPIHAITFVTRGAENLMQRVARMTRGSYTHIQGPGA